MSQYCEKCLYNSKQKPSRDVNAMIADESFPRVLRPRAAPLKKYAQKGFAVMTCHFNSCKFQSPHQNYLRFAAALKEHDVPLFTAELAFDESPFVLEQTSNVHRFRTRHVLWHKERLLNLLLKHVPPQYDKIAWIDADLLFQNPNWASEAAEGLDSSPVLQLFENAVYRDRAGVPSESQTGIAKALSLTTNKTHPPGSFHPGFAWAARRELLETAKLFDASICGGGDFFMVAAMYGWWAHPHLSYYPPTMRRAFNDWARPFWSQIRGNVGFVPGTVYHLWHGDRSRRQYSERFGWLRQARYDPAKHLSVDASGLWQWNPGTELLQGTLRRYFQDRREDG